MDDPDVEFVDQHQDGGSGVGSADADLGGSVFDQAGPDRAPAGILAGTETADVFATGSNWFWTEPSVP